MSDTDSNPPQHGKRWSDEEKHKVMQLRRNGEEYKDIATKMGRTKHAVKQMCEILERTQSTQQNPVNNNTTSKQIKPKTNETNQLPTTTNNTPITHQQIPWPAHTTTTNNTKDNHIDTKNNIQLDIEITTTTSTPSLNNQIKSKNQIETNETNETNNNSQTEINSNSHAHEPENSNERKDTNNDSDNTDCVIISVTSNKTPKKKKGSQGSDAEYRRMVQKLGQAMDYKPGTIVTYFVPRLAQRGRYNNRMGKIESKVINSESNYKIIDLKNNIVSIVPWKWILQAPPNYICDNSTANSENKSVTSLNEMNVNIPMNTLSTREEKEKEFNRRMKYNKHNSMYKQYSVPVYGLYDDCNRWNGMGYGHGHGHDMMGGIHTYDDYHVPYRQSHGYVRKQSKQLRSLSVFPQRISRKERMDRIERINCENNSPQTQQVQGHGHGHGVPPLQNDSNRKVIDIDDVNGIDIKPENSNKNKGYYNRKSDRDLRDKDRITRSRSRSPSHVRPGNRINGNEQYTAPLDSSNNKQASPHPIVNGIRDRMDRDRMTHGSHGYYNRDGHRDVGYDYYERDMAIRERDRGMYYNKYRYNDGHGNRYDGRYHNRYDSPPMISQQQKMMPTQVHHGIMKRSRSRSRERDRDRERDYYNRMSPTYDYYNRDYHREYRRDRMERERDYYNYYERRDRDRDRYRRDRERDRLLITDKKRSNSNNRNCDRNSNSIGHSLLMQTWLQVTNRMRGGSKLGEREINYLCKNDIRPELIKQLMDSDKPIQEKYDMVAHCVDPTNGQNLNRSQVYSIIGAVITMNF